MRPTGWERFRGPGTGACYAYELPLLRGWADARLLTPVSPALFRDVGSVLPLHCGVSAVTGNAGVTPRGPGTTGDLPGHARLLLGPYLLTSLVFSSLIGGGGGLVALTFSLAVRSQSVTRLLGHEGWAAVRIEARHQRSVCDEAEQPAVGLVDEGGGPTSVASVCLGVCPGSGQVRPSASVATSFTSA